MLRVAVVVLADTETSEALGRVVNALITAKECHQAGDDISVIFDGAGTRWIPTLASSEHRYHRLYEDVRETFSGACAYCAKAYGVRREVEQAGIALLDDFDQHPSLRSLIADGYHVLTF